jgi:acyl-homoserine lactone acylase PvdQ
MSLLIPRTFLPLILLSLTSLPCCFAVPRGSSLEVETVAWSVTIYRDTYGVPHVYGPTDASVVFGFVYAQAEDNFSQIEDNYIRALGRASEMYGEKTLADDLLVKTLEISRLSIAEYGRANARSRELCDATAAGLNYFLLQNPRVKPKMITHFEPWYVLALIRFQRYEFVFDLAGVDRSELLKKAVAVGTSHESNVWALGPGKSATGHAMLFINPHDPFLGLGQFYEGHLTVMKAGICQEPLFSPGRSRTSPITNIWVGAIRTILLILPMSMRKSSMTQTIRWLTATVTGIAPRYSGLTK